MHIQLKIVCHIWKSMQPMRQLTTLVNASLQSMRTLYSFLKRFIWEQANHFVTAMYRTSIGQFSSGMGLNAYHTVNKHNTSKSAVRRTRRSDRLCLVLEVAHFFGLEFASSTSEVGKVIQTYFAYIKTVSKVRALVGLAQSGVQQRSESTNGIKMEFDGNISQNIPKNISNSKYIKEYSRCDIL